MTKIEMARLARETRQAQDAYFQARREGRASGGLLSRARELERRLDDAVADVIDRALDLHEPFDAPDGEGVA